MIIVTGGCGFIGSNIVKQLNERGHKDIIVVDNLTNGKKFLNIADCDIADYWDKEELLARIDNNTMPEVSCIFHEGACSSTTEWDGKFMMQVNYDYSKRLLHWCEETQTAFIYASSASVYGGSSEFREDRSVEKPLNVYGYSKFQFDQYVRRQQLTTQVVGLRYFNVYGPQEQHKGSMASVAFHLNNQLLAGDTIKLFAGCDGYGDGEQKRDFVYVDDVVAVNLWFMDNPAVSGIFNCGSGNSQSFNDVANAVLAYHQRGNLEYIPFPDHLKGAYQSFTEADLTELRKVGCNHPFKTVEEGVRAYMVWLNQ